MQSRRNDAQVARNNVTALFSAASGSSVFDLASDGGELQWSSIYFYLGLGHHASDEITDTLVLLGRLHPGVASDWRFDDALNAAKRLRDTLEDLKASAYAHSEACTR